MDVVVFVAVGIAIQHRSAVPSRWISAVRAPVRNRRALQGVREGVDLIPTI